MVESSDSQKVDDPRGPFVVFASLVATAIQDVDGSLSAIKMYTQIPVPSHVTLPSSVRTNFLLVLQDIPELSPQPPVEVSIIGPNRHYQDIHKLPVTEKDRPHGAWRLESQLNIEELGVHHIEVMYLGRLITRFRFDVVRPEEAE